LYVSGFANPETSFPLRNRTRWLFVLPIIFFLLFYFYPLGSIFKLSFAPDGQLQLDALRRLFRTDYYIRTLWFTTWQAVISTALTLLLALPGAYSFATFRFRGKETLRTISTLPFVLPTVVVANAFSALLGTGGLLNRWLIATFNLDAPPIQLEQSIGLILLAHIFYNYSVALRIISAYWQGIGDDVTEAAAMLGANPRRVTWTVTLPLLRPAIAAAAVLVFIFTFTSFGVILILGGPGFATLEVEIYRQAVDLFNLPVAAALSLLQIIFTFGLMWVYTRTQARIAGGRNRYRRTRLVQTTRERLFVGGNLAVMIILLASPLIALLVRSFTGQTGWTLAFYRQLFINERGSIFYVPPIMAVRNSIGFALATTVVALLLGLISAYMIAGQRSDSRQQQKQPFRFGVLVAKVKSWLDPLFMLPLATSAVTLGFGYIIALDEPPLNLRDSLAMIPIAHSLVAIPFVIRAVLPAIRHVDQSLREAAAMLGADPQRIWRTIDWPLIRRAAAVAAVFAFTISMGEFGATLFLNRPNTPTMPTAIYRFLGQPGALNYGQAVAMSSLLMLVCAIGFVAIERFRIGNEGEF
jgi:thiamine transport system permease protein